MPDSKKRKRKGNPFFANLESFDNFSSVSDLRLYTPAPKNWVIVITDIQGSTKAITEGRYKDVNMVGAASITAVINVTRANEVPYAFGGDGATFVVPVETLPRIRQALLKTQNLAKSGFGLTLRVGAVPLDHVRAKNADVLVAKYRLSPGNFLAMFAGGGVGMADKMIKDDDGSQGYLLEDAFDDTAPDLEGLSCRWEPLASQRGIMLSILIQVLPNQKIVPTVTYEEVLADLNIALGGDTQKNRPVKAENMRFRWPPRGLKAEALATKGDRSYWRHLIFLYWQSFLQFLMERFNLSGGGYNAPVYREELRANSDYQRFDDTLRMVLDCTTDEVTAIQSTLARFRKQGLIAYGLHQADSALMTCLLFSLTDSEHVHFIDGADGGYAMAARQLKQQLAEK